MAKQDEEKPSHTPGSEGSGIPAGSLDRLRECNEQLTFATLHAQEQTDHAQIRYQDLVEGLEAIVWEATANPWRFTFVSERAAEMLGYPVQQWTSTSDFWNQMVHPNDREAALAALHREAAVPKDFRLQFRVVGREGQSQWMAMIGRHARDKDDRGQYRGLLMSVEDSIRADTLQKLVADQTRELLDQQDELRALGTELNLAEHRVRTKMAAELHDHLAQMLAVARLKLGQARQVKTHPRASLELIEKTDEVLDKCLTYTRTLVAELSPPVLHEFGLPAALTWLARHMRRYDLAVQCELPPSPPWEISHDQAVLVFQSVRELLINVAKHAETGKATVRLHADAQMLQLVVEDHGRGFDPSALTQSEASHSSKFGLFSIRERMRALGGGFEVTSVPGEGTRSTLTLPLRTGVAFGVPPAPVQTRGPRSKAPTSQGDRPSTPSQTVIRVLLVDDHRMIRESLRTVVDSYAHLHVIAEASNGAEAVEAVRTFHPDVVVMDINMPVMNGIDAARLIKREFREVGIVGLSIHDSGEMVERMSEAGISAYVTKEAAVKTLCRAIEEASARRV